MKTKFENQVSLLFTPIIMGCSYYLSRRCAYHGAESIQNMILISISYLIVSYVLNNLSLSNGNKINSITNFLVIAILFVILFGFIFNVSYLPFILIGVMSSLMVKTIAKQGI